MCTARLTPGSRLNACAFPVDRRWTTLARCPPPIHRPAAAHINTGYQPTDREPSTGWRWLPGTARPSGPRRANQACPAPPLRAVARRRSLAPPLRAVAPRCGLALRAASPPQQNDAFSCMERVPWPKTQHLVAAMPVGLGAMRARHSPRCAWTRCAVPCVDQRPLRHAQTTSPRPGTRKPRPPRDG